MTSTEYLRQEHDVIARVLGVLESLAERIERRGPPGASQVAACIEFLEAFVEGLHEVKEEQALFPVLSEHAHGFGAGPLTALRAEHLEARRLLAALREQGLARTDPLALARSIRQYVEFQRQHLAKENTILLPYASQLLRVEEDQRVREACERIEAGAGGDVMRRALFDLADAIERAAHADQGPWPVGRDPACIAAHVMRPAVPGLAPGDSLARAAELMGSIGVRELPVVEQGRLVGILARADLRPHEGHYEWTVTGEAMTPQPVTVTPGTPVGAVARLLFERGFNCVPVVADGGALVGMVARSDLLKLLANDGGA